ncbi:MAG: ribonuclease III [Bacilli bacterium]|nr:ribonuclease III [Bacilli bacterium]
MEKELPNKYELLSGANLAFIGDAYYELRIRKYLIDNKITKSNELKNLSVKYVSAHAHYLICTVLLDMLTETEKTIYKRGRNGAHHNYRRNLDYNEYNCSTGFEAVIGYLYLQQDFKRLDELIELSIKIIEEGKI